MSYRIFRGNVEYHIVRTLKNYKGYLARFLKQSEAKIPTMIRGSKAKA